MVRAVDGVDLIVACGAFRAIVGESGCGKTTLARAMVGLQPAKSGSVRFLGQDVTATQDQPEQETEGHDLSMVGHLKRLPLLALLFLLLVTIFALLHTR